MDRLKELTVLIDRFSTEEGVNETPIPGLMLIRGTAPTSQVHALMEPTICLIAQGRKRTMMGDQVFEYDGSKYLIASVDVPIVGQILEASDERPYLCLRIDLDRKMLSEMLLEIGDGLSEAPCSSSLAVSDVTPDLLDVAIRLVRLLETPKDIPVLGKMVMRELIYRLLMGEQGARLRQMAHGESRLGQINRAIIWIKENFRESFAIETLASEARMSASALHQHFKQVTAMSPLQYQKQMRLQEARRLILVEAMDAASASHAVGYESPSQFSREYRRLFGAPPVRDAARLRESATLIGADAP